MIDTIELYHNLIRIDSTNGNEKKIIDYIAGALRYLDLESKYIYHKSDIHKQRPSIYTRIKGNKPGKAFMLIGHVDTVEVGPGWRTDPFEPVVKGNKTYGLGSMDMKGGIASIIKTLEFFAKNRDLFSGEIIGAFVADEEYASKGTFSLIEEDLNIDMAIMAEGRQDLAVGFRGRYSIDISVSGVAKHSQFYPNHGDSAIIKANKLGLTIEDIESREHPKLGKGTYMVKHINGGHKNTLTVPETCNLIIEKFFVVGEDFESIRDEIYMAADSLGFKNDIEVNLRTKETEYMEPFFVDEDHLLVSIMKNEYRNITGNEAEVTYDRSVCDSNIIAKYWGIPVITFGPSGEGLHGANEFGYHEEIETCRDIYINTIKRLMNNQ